MVFGSMGSCTGGSIRGPASHNSIVGLKPTYGLVSRFGVFPLSWSIDHAGPMTRTVEDCAIMLGAVAGYDAQDPSSARVPIPDYRAALDRNIRGIRVGIPRELNGGASAEVAELIQKAIVVLQELGAEVTELSLPITGEYTGATGNIITWSEMAQVHAPWLDRLDEYTPMVQQKVRLGLVAPSTMYHKAQQLRRLIQAELAEALQQVDVLVSPIQNTPPGPIQQASIRGGPPRGGGGGAARGAIDMSSTRTFNLTGQPAVSVPCGFSPQGLPVGLQIAGRAFEDDLVLKVAHAYEQATEWHTMHPKL
jgi:aspartyl-tRNA(Asn)/glutamyl-tRNA(Gln) amidotransferase subunit A